MRRALAGAGAARVGVSTYVPGPRGAGADPRRLPEPEGEGRNAVRKLAEDLASGSSLEGWQNEPYANFGCATQAVLAAQVDDPRDFVQPRALGPSDAVMRMRAIDAVRKGEDPGTKWKTDLVPIGAGGGIRRRAVRAAGADR